MIEEQEMKVVCDNLIEPFFIVNIKKQAISYCNDVTKRLGMVDETMDLEYLLRVVELPESFDNLSNKVLLVPECKVPVPELGKMSIQMRMVF